ncbi:MAG TPA: beta-ketoacyl-ACP synthase, partial [Pseudobdellovibrionaceae bacterium]|nr:beta-ketoacyl-ACP synthase [Pseudobdellovibrionaceae bacterium]
GAQELIMCLMMLENGVLLRTLNLEEVAPECDKVLHIQDNLKRKAEYALSNNFALGGINTSFILRTRHGGTQ